MNKTTICSLNSIVNPPKSAKPWETKKTRILCIQSHCCMATSRRYKYAGSHIFSNTFAQSCISVRGKALASSGVNGAAVKHAPCRSTETQIAECSQCHRLWMELHWACSTTLPVKLLLDVVLPLRGKRAPGSSILAWGSQQLNTYWSGS